MQILLVRMMGRDLAGVISMVYRAHAVPAISAGIIITAWASKITVAERGTLTGAEENVYRTAKLARVARVVELYLDHGKFSTQLQEHAVQRTCPHMRATKSAFTIRNIIDFIVHLSLNTYLSKYHFLWPQNQKMSLDLSEKT